MACPKLRVKNDAKNCLQCCVLWASFEGMYIVGFVPKAQDTLVLLRQISEEGGIQEKCVIAVVVEILLLQDNVRIMVIEEYGLPWFQYWNTLTMNTGGVKQES